jgi:hypothetical protein
MGLVVIYTKTLKTAFAVIFLSFFQTWLLPVLWHAQSAKKIFVNSKGKKYARIAI